MTRTHYRHRFARAFRRLAAQRPDLSLPQLFQLCHRQLLENRIAALLAEAHQLSTRYRLRIIRGVDRTTDLIPYRRHTEARIRILLAQAAVLSVRLDRPARRVGRTSANGERGAQRRPSLRT